MVKRLQRLQILACALGLFASALSSPVQAATTITGTIADQPDAPVKIASCLATLAGASFVPDITFDTTAASQVTSSIVRFQFFDVANGPLTHVDIEPPYKAMDYPAQATSFTCSIVRENLANGTLWGASTPAARSSSIVPYLVAVAAGIGFVAAVASGSGRHSIFVPAVTPAPTRVTTSARRATPVPTLVPGATPTPTPTPADASVRKIHSKAP